ncbi:hypothetical protein [Mucilaginibacter ginsenosidivorax]|uniref:Uncharacterized protein n=1 Tax=Mucilaginibacter ginsenosidivorax TaxID=862126 RepID=A0A5B8WA49_9SPHI|nr:hypothetical protein [Mucilaginibacter ginsenosidivorax]QEC79732.1 hypothetical protein FSB76_28655 [Mucilaginibacter ginsenosidivorax]
MELQITFLSEDKASAIEHTAGLRKKIKFYLPEADVEKNKIKEGDAGAESEIISMLLGAGFAGKLFEIIKSYIVAKIKADVDLAKIDAKKSKIEVSGKNAQGEDISIVITCDPEDLTKFKDLLKTTFN